MFELQRVTYWTDEHETKSGLVVATNGALVYIEDEDTGEGDWFLRNDVIDELEDD